MRKAGTVLLEKPTLAIGLAILLVLIAIAILAPWIGTVDPTTLSPMHRTRFPGEQFWFGTDLLGRDVYSRVIYGSRISLFVGASVALLVTLIGTAIGVCAGYLPAVDAVVMRIIDGMMAIPTILLAIVLLAVARPSLMTVILVISIAETPRVVRLVRGVVLALREQPFVESAVASGAGAGRIIVKHILPNTFAPLIVQATFVCGVAVLAEASLSFIGVGVPPTTPSWGNIMADGRALWQIRPNLIALPACFLTALILAINMIGDGMRDLLDPRIRKSL